MVTYANLKISDWESRSRADTLVRGSMTLNATARRTETKAVNKAVQHDIDGHTHLCSLQQFLDKFFTVNDTALFQDILNKLTERKKYSNNQGNESKNYWVDFPFQSGHAESPYYKAFTDVANSILDLIPEEKKQLRSVWIDRHKKAPTSTTTNAAQNCPDVLNCLGTKEEWDTLEEKRRKQMATTDQETAEQTEAGNETPNTTDQETPEQAKSKKRKADDTEAPPPKPLSQKELKFLSARWLRTIVPVEVKPKDVLIREDVQKTIIQLAGYMRQILREQQDRRYVIGVILFHRSISLWYCDRSGLLGSSGWINIDTNPLDFIRVIANFNMLSPFDLGWDSTMQLCIQDRPTPVYSFDPTLKATDVPTVRDNISWRIQLPLRKEVDGKEVHGTMDFITVKSLSVSRAEVMCGRATLVWLALDVQSEKMVVLKQSWRPVGTEIMSENDMYEAAGKSPHLSEVWLNWDSEVDTNRLRGGLDITSLKDHLLELRSKKSAPARLDDDDSLHIRLSDSSQFLEELQRRSSKEPETIPRVLNRIVFADYGWPIKYFADRSELLTILHDALEGYEYLWDKGIAHRDISTGNVMISLDRTKLLNWKDTTDATLPTRGRIIDLDHSKIDKFCVNEKFTFGRANEIKIRNMDLNCEADGLPYPSQDLADMVITASGGKSAPSMSYLTDLLEGVPILASSHGEGPVRVTPAEVGIFVDEQTKVPPTFESHVPRVAFRSGTLPYMSHALLGSSSSPHVSIHDMESFFWVVIYICLTRSGPGAQRRKELSEPWKDSKSETEIAVSGLLFCFFDGNINHLEENKAELFKHPADLEKYVLRYFDPYFDCLKGLVRAWWRTLTLAFKFPFGYEYNYPVLSFKDAVQKAIVGLPPSVMHEDQRNEATLAEHARRREDLQLVQNALAHLGYGSTTLTSGDVDTIQPPMWDSSPGSQQVGTSGKLRYNNIPFPESPTPASKKPKLQMIGSS